MVRAQVLAGNRGQIKTHDRCQPWVNVEIALRATSPAGIASDDDYQQPNLNRGQNHHRENRRILLGRSSLESRTGVCESQGIPRAQKTHDFRLAPAVQVNPAIQNWKWGTTR
jgi:ribosomal protein L37E